MTWSLLPMIAAASLAFGSQAVGAAAAGEASGHHPQHVQLATGLAWHAGRTRLTVDGVRAENTTIQFDFSVVYDW